MKRNPGDDRDPRDPFRQMQEMMEELTGGDSLPVTIREGDEEINVVAEVPGAERDEIDIDCDGRTLAIRVSAEGRPYATHIDLPAYVDEQPTHDVFNNGVLEVTFEQANDPANIGFH